MCNGVSRRLPCVFCGSWTVHKPLSSELACGQKRLSCVEKDCLMSGVVALTSRRVASLSSPQAWTIIVQC